MKWYFIKNKVYWLQILRTDARISITESNFEKRPTTSTPFSETGCGLLVSCSCAFLKSWIEISSQELLWQAYFQAFQRVFFMRWTWVFILIDIWYSKHAYFLSRLELINLFGKPINGIQHLITKTRNNPYLIVVDRVQNSSGSGWNLSHCFGFGSIGFTTWSSYRVRVWTLRVLGFIGFDFLAKNYHFIGKFFTKTKLHSFMTTTGTPKVV